MVFNGLEVVVVRMDLALNAKGFSRYFTEMNLSCFNTLIKSNIAWNVVL